jgi:hypothetical protein
LLQLEEEEGSWEALAEGWLREEEESRGAEEEILQCSWRQRDEERVELQA